MPRPIAARLISVRVIDVDFFSFVDSSVNGVTHCPLSVGAAVARVAAKQLHTTNHAGVSINAADDRPAHSSFNQSHCSVSPPALELFVLKCDPSPRLCVH